MEKQMAIKIDQTDWGKVTEKNAIGEEIKQERKLVLNKNGVAREI